MQPNISYNLSNEYHIESSGTWTFDGLNHAFRIPAALGAGEVLQREGGHARPCSSSSAASSSSSPTASPTR